MSMITSIGEIYLSIKEIEAVTKWAKTHKNNNEQGIESCPFEDLEDMMCGWDVAEDVSSIINDHGNSEGCRICIRLAEIINPGEVGACPCWIDLENDAYENDGYNKDAHKRVHHFVKQMVKTGKL